MHSHHCKQSQVHLTCNCIYILLYHKIFANFHRGPEGLREAQKKPWPSVFHIKNEGRASSNVKSGFIFHSEVKKARPKGMKIAFFPY